MKKIFILLIFIIIPACAYEIFSPNDYRYANEGDKLLFIVDFSNSMTDFSEGKTKINQIRDMMGYILPQISPNTKVGLRVYGHTCNLIAYNACRSSELVVPLGYKTASDINNKLLTLRPRGMTPITYSLKQAVKKDLSGYDGIKHIILLTDGGENCDESPCDYSIELIKSRRDIKIDVIAYNVPDEDDLAQLKCTADVTGGNFSSPETKAELFRSMEDMVTPHKNVEAVIYQRNN